METRKPLSLGIQQEMFEGNIVSGGITEDGVKFEVFERSEELPNSGSRKERLIKFSDGSSLNLLKVKEFDSKGRVILDREETHDVNGEGIEVHSIVNVISAEAIEHTITEINRSSEGENISYLKKTKPAGAKDYDYHIIYYIEGRPSEDITVSRDKGRSSITLFDRNGKVEKRSVTRTVGGTEIKAIYGPDGRLLSHTKTFSKKRS